MTMESQSLAKRLAQMSAADKQRLLAHLLREKASQQAAQQGQTDMQEWVQDAQLDPNIQPVGPASRRSDPQTVLLTGATGFLGAHLLQDLYQHSAATIYCLVRASNDQEARQRLQTNFARYFAHTLDPDRIRPLVGDQAQPQLGLAP